MLQSSRNSSTERCILIKKTLFNRLYCILLHFYLAWDTSGVVLTLHHLKLKENWIATEFNINKHPEKLIYWAFLWATVPENVAISISGPVQPKYKIYMMSITEWWCEPALGDVCRVMCGPWSCFMDKLTPGGKKDLAAWVKKNHEFSLGRNPELTSRACFYD